jgi:hypothetical protein
MIFELDTDSGLPMQTGMLTPYLGSLTGY